MASLFCCSDVQPFRPAKLEHELKFTSFLIWARFPRSSSPYGFTIEKESNEIAISSKWPYALQLVRQVNYGPLESKRYFVPQEGQQYSGSERAFEEVREKDLIEANFSKVNSYKNFRCGAHNKFFEMNLYAKDPVNTHHWRVNIARPADDIDLARTGVSMPESGLVGITNPTSAIARTDSGGKEKGNGGRTSTPPISTSVEPKISSGINSSTRSSAGDRDEPQSNTERDNNFYSKDDEQYSENEGPKDYAACSKECGYCGECDY